MNRKLKVSPSLINGLSEEMFRHRHEIEWLKARVEKLEKKQKG